MVMFWLIWKLIVPLALITLSIILWYFITLLFVYRMLDAAHQIILNIYNNIASLNWFKVSWGLKYRISQRWYTIVITLSIYDGGGADEYNRVTTLQLGYIKQWIVDWYNIPFIVLALFLFDPAIHYYIHIYDILMILLSRKRVCYRIYRQVTVAIIYIPNV